MKATIDIPDDLYRRVKARSALEGRPLRAVAIELFQDWLHSRPDAPEPEEDRPTAEELARYPWLTISRKYVQAGISHEMDDIRESIARGWGSDAAEGSSPKRARRGGPLSSPELNPPRPRQAGGVAEFGRV